MIKIVKISSHVISTIILIVVVIPMVLSLVLQNSTVQTWVVQKATTFLSNKIDSRISIGRIDIGKFYNIKIYELFVESKMGRDTLLYTNKLTTRLASFRLAESDMALSYVRLEGGEFNLYSVDSMTNIKEIIERIRGGKPKKENPSEFKMSIGEIEIDSLTFRYQKKDAESVAYGINYQDMEMNNISMKLDEFRLVGDSIHVKVKKIAMEEKGGILLNKLSLKELIISSSVMQFTNGDIVIDNDSYLKFDTVKISYQGWNMADFINSVPMEALISDSRIGLATVAKFTKQPRKWQSVIDFKGTFMGTISSMHGHVERALISKTEILDTDYYIYGITDISNTIFDFTVGKLSSTPNDATLIISDFSNGNSKMTLPKALVGHSMFNIKGSFLGKMRNFDAECRISTPRASDGFIKANLNLQAKGNHINVDGSVVTGNFNTQSILNNKKLERVSLNIYMNGLLEKNNSSLSLKGGIDSVLFNSYNYHAVTLNGEMEKKSFTGYVGCDDPNLDFKFNGLLDFSAGIPAYNFNLDLKQADLHAIGLNKRDTVSVLSGRIMADGFGDTIDNLDAIIVLDNLRYINHRDTTIAENAIRIEAANNENSKSLNVTSDYFDLSFKGVHSYYELFNYIKKSSGRFIPALMPTIAGSSAETKRVKNGVESADDYYVITLDVKKANNLANIFVPSLTLADGSKLSFIFNPSADNFSLNLSSSYIFFKNNMIYNLLIDSKSVGDLVNVFARAEEVYVGTIFLPNFSVIGDIQNDVISADFGFSNSEDNTYAIIKSKTTVLRNEGELEYKIKMLPSTLNLYRDVWKSSGGEILVAKKRITVSDYSLISTDQSLRIDGAISDSKRDTLRVTLDNFSLKPTSLFTSKIGFVIDGAVSGEVIGSALMNKEARFMDADLTFKKNVINGIALADGHFYTGWEEESRRLDFNFESEGIKYIWGSADTKGNRYSARVKIPKFNIALINPFLAGIAGNPVGDANVDIMISNPKKFLEINGEVDIPSLDATIIPTNVRYNISGKAIIKENQYSLENGLVTDAFGGKGVLTAWMTNEKYKKVKYSIGVKANKLLGLNTTEQDNSQFYGRAFATGDVLINGDRNKITLSVDATASKRSTFFLPLGGRTISEVSFIKFAEPPKEVAKTHRQRAQKEVSKNTTSFEMKMRLTATPLLETEIVMDPLTGSSIKATGNGLIDIDIQPANEVFTINGEYTIDKGTYRFILPNFNLVDKLFTIKNGSWIRWNGDPLNATLNVDAIYSLKASLAPLLGDQAGMSNRVGVDCVMALKGELTQPDITLGVEVPNAGPEEQSVLKSVLNTQEAISTQLFFLLFTNSFYATSAGTTAGDIGQLGATTTGIEFLTSQINNIFSSEKLNFGINYRPLSDLSSNEFEFDISAPILNNKLYIDVTGNYNFMDNTHSLVGSNQSNWSGDVYLTWLLNNSGNLSLKAFTKTLDTFDENQGLQESGVGIYLKSDFDTFKDLKLRYKEYRLRRKEERQEKQEKKKNNINNKKIK